MNETITIRRLGPDDWALLCSLDDALFDNPVDPAQARAFLDDPLHEIVVAFDGPLAVSFVSGSVLLHPDKQPAMFINEVGTHEGHRRRGLATACMRAFIALARARGCKGIWLGTEKNNRPARAFYRAIGAEDEVMGVLFGWDEAL